jgi:S1-C subfamily serine protease
MNRIFICFLLITISSQIKSQVLKTDDYIDRASTTSINIVSYKNLSPLKTGTGFFVRTKSGVYLLTNDHMVGGKFANDEYLRDHKKNIPADSIPDSIILSLFGENLGSIYKDGLAVREKKTGKPLWIPFYEDEKNKNTLLDVVAIKVDMSSVNPHNTTSFDVDNDYKSEMKLYPGMDVFIIGYPSDSTFNVSMPVWKRGTIASEPTLSPVGNSNFLIDATTRKGMSGSPVVFKGLFLTEKNGNLKMLGGTTVYLIGIYSAQSYSMELGNAIVIDKIIQKLKAL